MAPASPTVGAMVTRSTFTAALYSRVSLSKAGERATSTAGFPWLTLSAVSAGGSMTTGARRMKKPALAEASSVLSAEDRLTRSV